MLSFFKKKSPENEVPMDNQSNANQSIEFAEDALLRELGYRDSSDLRETIYGKFACYLVTLIVIAVEF